MTETEIEPLTALNTRRHGRIDWSLVTRALGKR